MPEFSQFPLAGKANSMLSAQFLRAFFVAIGQTQKA